MSIIMDLWAMFDRGHRLSDSELDSLIKQTEDALPYLRGRTPHYHLAYKDTIQTLIMLNEYKAARKKKSA